MTANQIAYWNNQETIRANLARERETHRANRAKETETMRSNLVEEAETQRSNKAREKETHRHNRWDEATGVVGSATKGVSDIGKAVAGIAALFA